MKIAVYGSALNSNPEIAKLAKQTGEIIAQRNHILITGGCPGLPYEAALGARIYNGKVIGFSPATSLEEHRSRFNFPTECFTDWVFIPSDFHYINQKDACLKLRNVYSSAECDVAIIIAGRRGSINEYTNTCDMKKPLGVLFGTGGATILIPVIEAVIQKPGGPIIYNKNPEHLVIELERLVQSSA